jgi:hypothetical protein
MFLYFSGLTFTWRPTRHNQPARVSKSPERWPVWYLQPHMAEPFVLRGGDHDS